MTEEKGGIVVLGMFDGVHIGHAALFAAAKALSRENGLRTIAYTFKNHPLELISGAKPKLLLDEEERKNTMLSLGVDTVVMDEFDRELRDMEAEDFIKMLMSRFFVKHIIAGFNYTFGRLGAGNTEALFEFGKKYGFGVHVVKPVMYNGEVVSSSRIRSCIENGDIESANAQLTHNFTIKGTVVRGRRVGRMIGFPTANIKNETDRPVPLYGVYATRVHMDGKTYMGVTNVGNNPTFDLDELSVETHIFDFDEDIYGKMIEVEFLSFIRKQTRFLCVDDLKSQITKDKKRASQIHSST